ncbi:MULTISPECIES: CRISPR-associated helicase Cas3' [unclassified Microcoleus]|uniref:CRISPR-associated helicase Cas3' n=1 Tax=unclassified Microcoleus TaxID=2642155 RepID=UPI002FD0ADD9
MSPELKQPKRLLAKSIENGWKGSYSLIGHTADVVNAMTTLVEILGDRLIVQFGLTCNVTFLLATVRLAAYLHDWGKANNHFQQMVRGKRQALNEPQMVRHEALSVLLALEFREWLEQGEGDFFTAVAAAGGHHLKLGGKAGKLAPDLFEIRASGDDRIYLYTAPQYFKDILKYGVKKLGLPRSLPQSVRNLPSNWTVADITQRRSRIERAFADWEPEVKLLAVVKSLLIASDSIGSASGQNDRRDIQKVWEGLKSTLTEPDLQNVIKERLKGNAMRPFQVDLGNASSRVTLARAGCGTGKTLGAYNWAKTHAVGRKLFFCYPTTGTSTEGFLDYVQDEVESVLLHSRADVDLELARTREEEDNGTELFIDDAGKLMQAFENETAKKLDSFKAWGVKVSICTVDTVLGLLQCNRRPLYCFPVIAQAAFVFDEVHCYDDALFGALLRFLEMVKAPVLLMSASFLPWQIAAIEKAAGEKVPIIPGDAELEQYNRYQFHLVEAPNWERVEAELAKGGKVLWVCNQVNEAIEVYRTAKSKNLNAVLYHSRFRYSDRVEHHRAVLDGFKKDEPVIAIATQVAEMSLDLSATLLVSQLADPAGLIQRLGRLNRKYCGHALDAMFYPPPNRYPYEQEEIAQGRILIQSFDGEVNQAQLAAWLEKMGIQGKPKTQMVLLDGKWRTYPAALREAGYTVTALLEQDIATVNSSKASELSRYTVPLTAKETKHWQRHKKGFLIAPKEEWTYSKEIGAKEVK